MQMDKILHFMAGYGIVVTGVALGAPYVALGFGLGAGLAKEVFDKYQNKKAIKAGLPAMHSVDKMDFAATAAGSALGFLVSLAVPFVAPVIAFLA